MIVGMLDYALSPDQLVDLRQVHRRTRDKREADRIKAVVLLATDWTAGGGGGSFAGRSQHGARALQALWYKVVLSA